MHKQFFSVLEVTQTHIKLAHAKISPSGRAIVFLGLKEIKESSNEIVAKAIKELVSGSKIKTSSLVCIFARGSTIVRNLRLPSQDPAEIEDMLDFQIKQQIPYPKEDIISDYIISTRHKDGYADTLLVTAHKDVIERYMQILNSVAINPEIFSISSIGISKWYNLYRSRIGRPTNEAVLLVNIDSAVTDLCFSQEGNLLFSRAISFGMNELNAEKIEGFLEQMHLTLTTYRKEKINPDVSRIVLLTQSAKATFLSQRLNTEFSLPVEIINPLADIPTAKGTLLGMAAIGDVSFTAVLGLVLGAKDDELNLLPEAERQKQNMKYMKKEFFFSGSLLILTVLVILGSVFLNIYKKEQYLKNLDIQLNAVAPIAQKVDDTTKKLGLIKEQLNYSNSGIDVIYELYNLLPSSMSLNVFNLDEKGNLTLQGVSSQMSDIFSFQSKLEKSKNFKNVEVKYASKRMTSQGEVTDFRITCQTGEE